MKGSKFNRHNTLELLSMAIIPLAFLICFSYIPLAGLQIAFKKFTYTGGMFGSPWCGLDNFKYLFATQDAYRITRNTIVLNLLFIVTTTSGGIIFAIILNEIRSRMAIRVYQTTMFLPYILSASVVACVVFTFLNTNYGFINTMLKAFGKQTIEWYSEPKYWYTILVLVHLWKGLGYNIVIYYASIISIDDSYYEAAAIDGAKWLQSRWYITLPMIAPLVVTLSIIAVGNIFYSDFGLFYMVPQNSTLLYPATDVIDTFVYRAMFDGSFSKSAAAGLYQSLVGFILVLIANHAARKFDENTALF